ncbi:MAG: alpha-N-acetylglucosaminidase TIM-barrel domain-containing protein, partial [Alphaproteobacteria bacterium]
RTQDGRLLQLTQAQAKANADSARAIDRINLTLGKLKNEIDSSAKFDPVKQKSIQDALEALKVQIRTLPVFDPAAIGGLAESVALLQKLIDTALDDDPVRMALRRLLPKHYRQIAWAKIDKPAGGQDTFRVYGKEGDITIEGTSPSIILTGLNAYLREAAHVDIGWPGDSLDLLPVRLPAPTSEIKRSAIVKNRFALNDTDDGYGDAYKSWPEWERKIDLLAMRGINEVFIPIGTEEVYRRTFKEFGYSDAEIRAWIPAPAHQPWWLLQIISGVGGPMTPELYKHRLDMGQKIVNRLRALGMTPVLPGYFGTVPDKLTDKNAGAQIVPQGKWRGDYQRPDWLD